MTVCLRKIDGVLAHCFFWLKTSLKVVKIANDFSVYKGFFNKNQTNFYKMCLKDFFAT